MDPYRGAINLPRTFHKYSYVGGDPVNRSDPSGLLENVEQGVVISERKALIPERAVIQALQAVVVCILTKTAYAVLGASEPDPNNPCRLRFSRCEQEYPEYKRCDELPRSYVFPNSTSAFEAIKKEMNALGLNTKNLRKLGAKTADRGPCEGTPGAKHYVVLQGKNRWASIGECKCCEDYQNSAPPVLLTKCAILSPTY